MLLRFDGETLFTGPNPGFPPEPWNRTEAYKGERDYRIKEDLLSPHIHWFRD